MNETNVDNLLEKWYEAKQQIIDLEGKIDKYKRIAENPDITEAYKKGRDAFLEYIRKTRAERVLEALDQLIMERHPAAVIFASKTILGLQETVTHNHTASGNPIANDDRLKELEAKRRMLMQSTEIVINAKKDDE